MRRFASLPVLFNSNVLVFVGAEKDRKDTLSPVSSSFIVESKKMPITNESNEVVNHFLFAEDAFFFQWKESKFTAIHFHLLFSLIGILCILGTLGGHFVDDDLVISPFVGNMRQSNVTSLRVTTLACSIPLYWDLIADVYNVHYRKIDPAQEVDVEGSHRLKTVCAKEAWLRCAFLFSMAFPSLLIILSNPYILVRGNDIAPFLAPFMLIILVFCPANGYISELYDATYKQRIGSLFVSLTFVIGILLVFFARMDVSPRAFRWDDAGGVCGLVMSLLAGCYFVFRSVWHGIQLLYKELTSLESVLRMEEYVFLCYSSGAIFILVSYYCSFFSHTAQTSRAFRYDQLGMHNILVYHVLYLVGVLTTIIVSARTIRNWSFDVRYLMVANHLSQIQGLVDSNLYNNYINENKKAKEQLQKLKLAHRQEQTFVRRQERYEEVNRGMDAVQPGVQPGYGDGNDNGDNGIYEGLENGITMMVESGAMMSPVCDQLNPCQLSLSPPVIHVNTDKLLDPSCVHDPKNIYPLPSFDDCDLKARSLARIAMRESLVTGRLQKIQDLSSTHQNLSNPPAAAAAVI